MPGTQKPSQNNNDSQALQNLGQSFAKNANKDVQNIVKGLVNNNTNQSSTTSKNNITLNQPSVNSGLQVLSMTFEFIIVFLIILSIKRVVDKRKDKSKWLKMASYYIKGILILGILGYILDLFTTIMPSHVYIYDIGVIVAAIIYIYKKITKKDDKKTKGTNLKSMKMERGVVLGAVGGKIIVKPSNVPGHVLVNGGSGLGKSQIVSIGSILNWEGSVLAIDIKRELYAYTHHVKMAQGKVIVFDPEQDGHAYDPIRECNTVDGCLFLARSIVPTPHNTPDPMWTMNAQNILAAACYEGHMEGKTLPDIAERILTTDQVKLIEELTNSRYKEAVLLASSVKGTPDKTLGGIFTELKSKLILFATDPNIKKALSKSEWSPETLEENTTIYLRVSESQIETYKPVWNIIIVQIFRYLSGRQEHKNPPILLLLDELARLGKVEGYAPSLPTLRSKNVTIVSAIQSIGQLHEHYGKDVTSTILDNKAYSLVLGAKHVETQKYFSDLAGKHEVKKVSKNAGLGTYGVSNYQQWEEKFRPENFAHLQKPIYYPPDQPAFEVDKVFWMNIPYLLSLQKKYGGPTTFINETEFKALSEFKRNDEIFSDKLDNMSCNTNSKEELIKEKKINLNKIISTDNENDVHELPMMEDRSEMSKQVDLLEKWDAIK